MFHRIPLIIFGAVCSVTAESLVARAQQMRSLSPSSCCRLLMTSLECCLQHNDWLWRTSHMWWHKLPPKPVPLVSRQTALPNGRSVGEVKGKELEWRTIVPNPRSKLETLYCKERLDKSQWTAFPVLILTQINPDPLHLTHQQYPQKLVFNIIELRVRIRHYISKWTHKLELLSYFMATKKVIHHPMYARLQVLPLYLLYLRHWLALTKPHWAIMLCN